MFYNLMGKVIREVYYFDEPGEHNTDDVINAVRNALKKLI